MADAEDNLAHASFETLAHASKLLLQRGNELFTAVTVASVASVASPQAKVDPNEVQGAGLTVITPEADNETEVPHPGKERDDLSDDFFELV